MTAQDETATSREAFVARMRQRVAANAPAVFALCQESDENEGGHILYWGFAHADHTDLIGVTGTMHIGFRDAATAHDRLNFHDDMHLVWA